MKENIFYILNINLEKMFTIHVAIPKPIDVNKNFYISSIKFKIPEFTIKNSKKIKYPHNSNKISHNDPSHSQR